MKRSPHSLGPAAAVSLFLLLSLFPVLPAHAYDQGYIYGWNISATLTNPAPTANDNFGLLGEVIGNYPRRYLVSATNDDTGAANAGCVYSYEYSGAEFVQTITNPAPAADDHFGAALAAFGGSLSVGCRLVVGAPDDDRGATDAGTIYFYDMTNGLLAATVTNPAPAAGDRFGAALAGGGFDLVVGAPGDDAGASDAGCAYLIRTNGLVVATMTNPAPAANDHFGWSVGVVQGGGYVVGAPDDDTGATDAGAVYRYDGNGVLQQIITNPAPAVGDHFGQVLEIMHNGFLVGAPDDDAGATDAGTVYLYDGSGNPGVIITNPAPAVGDHFGAVAARVEYGYPGRAILVGAPDDDAGAADAGTVYLFSTNGGLAMVFTNPAPAASERFGASLSEYPEGTHRMLIGCAGDDAGATDAGVAYFLQIYPYNRYAEQYGFDTSDDGWALATNASMRAFTNLVQMFADMPNYGTVGANNLQIDCNLSTNANWSEGRVRVDIAQWLPRAIQTPANLSNETIACNIFFASNSLCTGSNRFRWFVTDDSNRSQYSANWLKISNGWYANYLNVMTVVTSNGTQDAGFDPARIRYMGLQVAVATGQPGAYRGAIYLDNIRFPGIEAGFVAPTNQQYGFAAGKEGWQCGDYDLAATSCTWVASATSNSTGCLAIDVDLKTDPNWSAGEVFVNMEYGAPSDLKYPIDLDGRKVTAWLYCPPGSIGSNGYNSVSLFCKDATTNWLSFYGSEEHIVEGIWFPVSMTPVSNATPHYGWKADGFDPRRIRCVGLKIARAGVPYGGNFRGRLYMDGYSFTATGKVVIITNTTQHLYDFEAAYQAEWWKFAGNPDGWNARAWTNVYYATNEGREASIALAADATFVKGIDEVVTNSGVVVTNYDVAGKGVFEIAYQPALNLSTKDHRKIQAQLRFSPGLEPPATFDASINVFDKIADRWYKKDFKVSGSGWNVLDFDLDNAADYAPSTPGPMNCSQIGFITIQIFANSSWTGTVYLENVVVGGRETGTNYNRMGGAFVKAEGHKFTVGGTNFYHCGANIEYLQTVPDYTVTECLDWAASNRLQVIRTWAMQEGRPYSFQPARGVWNEVMFEHLDRIVAESGHRGIRLMLAVVDNWAHNGGVFQYMHWVYKEHPESVTTNLPKEGVLYHDQFWTNQWAKLWYKDYVTKLLNRTNTITGVVYKNDPTIFALEIVNEPRCESDFGGRTIHNWLHEMSDWVRTVDTNHILGNGEEGGYVNTYDFADTVPWESYPDNYYHYATYAMGSYTCDLYGCGRGHGVDFVADGRSQSTYVQWQGGLYTQREPVQAEWRTGNSNINFCTARIYVDQKEYNVWRTNVVGADQRFEWINDHWYDAQSPGALNPIGKPMIMEEIGIHAIGWVFNGFYGQVQYERTPEYTFLDRVNIYSQYYGHIERSGVSGSFFWNFGYSNMWDDFFHRCEHVEPWFLGTTNSAATAIEASTNYVRQGTNSLKLSWNVLDAASNRAVFCCATNEEWLLKVDNASTNEPPTHGINRTKFFWSFYNAGAQPIDVALAVRGSANYYWCETLSQRLTSGWNHLMFDLSSHTWAWISNGWQHTDYLLHIPSVQSNVLENIREVSLVFSNLPTGAGAAYVDDVRIKRDDGFVVYADDPVNPVIRWHADRCAARNVATNAPGNHAPVGSNLNFIVDTLAPTPVHLEASDADAGDYLSYRIVQRPQKGWIFGRPPDNMIYSPKPGYSGSDFFTYVVHDGKQDSAEAMVTVTRAGDFDEVRYDFEAGHEGWYANYKPSEGMAVTGTQWTTDRAIHGSGSLKAWINMNPTAPTNAGDAEVNLGYTPPANLTAPINLTEQPLQISVYCPPGSRGTNVAANRIQIYAKDWEWRAEYTKEEDIVEGEWVTFTMVVSTNTPPGGWTAPGFRPDQIRALGVRIKCSGGGWTGSSYAGPIYIDAVRFPVMERHMLYTFRDDTQEWTNENWGSGEATLSWTNVGNPNAGALVVTPDCGPSYGKFYIKDWDAVENENLFFRPVLRTYIWVPVGGPSNVHHTIMASLAVRSSTDYWQYGHQGPPVMLLPGQWNLVEWDLSSLPYEVLTDVDEIGLELVWQNRDAWCGPVFVDSIQAMGKTPEAAPTIALVTAATNSVGRYKKFELTVALNNVDDLNPYDPNLVDLRATFTGPTGRVWNVYGFYMEDPDDAYGGGAWRIRFAPDLVGTWSYQVSVRNTMGTNTSSAGNFTCVASEQHGWVRVSDDDAHYLEHNDDTAFLGMGYCRCWDGDDEGFFREAEEHGINMIHWWMAPWDTMLTVKPADVTESWRDKSSYDTYHQGRAAELDRVVGHAEKHNVKLVWTIWPHDTIRDFNYHKWRLNGSWQKAFDHKFSEPEWYINAFSELDDPPRNQKFFYDETYREYQSRLYRYIIARWGYSEAIGTWALVSEFFGTFANSLNCIRYQDPLYVTNKTALFGENPFQNMDTNQCDGADYTFPWLEYIHGYFKTNDPFGHPTTASYATDEYWDEGMEIVDIGQIHVYADLYNWITPPVTLGKYHHYLMEEHNKPSFMGEIGTVEWKLYEPDYTRVTAWPGICAGAAITPMMWTTPPFSWFGDAKMGPWLGTMSDEIKVLSKFMAGIEMHKMHFTPADAETRAPGEPPITVVESFESGTNGWRLWGNGIKSGFVTNAHATHGTNAWRLNVDMDTYKNMPDPASGIDKYEDDGLSYNWSNYWPRGTLKMDVYVPDFVKTTNDPDGFLLGINKDPRSIIEIFTKDTNGVWHWYSTTNEYGGYMRESGGWKKLTVGMLWNLELNLSYIPSAAEASQIVGIKFKFGDVGILKGPIYVDNITAGMYAYNTLAMVSSNKQFAYGWIQDRRWTNSLLGNSGATLQLNGLEPGNYNVEWWDTMVGPRETANASAATGTLVVTAPDFMKDIAFKVRRIGATGATVHDVAVGSVQEYDWVVKNPRQLVEVLVENQGTAGETFNVTLTDTSAGQVIGTNSVTLDAGDSVHTRFWWNCMSLPTNDYHVLTAVASTVGGESDTADNTMSGRTMVYAQLPPWDSCNGLRRWGPDSNDSDGRSLVVQTNYTSEGAESFAFYHRSPSKFQAYFGFDQVYENWSNRTSFAFDLYNADGSTNCQILMRAGSNWVWYYSAVVSISNGWNRNVTFRFDTNTWTRAEWNNSTTQNDYYYDVPVGGLEEMQQLFIKVAGYTNDGTVYIDNIRVDGWYTLRLGILNGMDVFPNAVAQQTNYTGAAANWMCARYLKGETFTQTQAQIYGATSHDPAHNGEITPQSSATWLYNNVPSGYYFSARYRTSLIDALKETVYWMDYVPGGGLQAPVQILSSTNWSYKVVRGFQSSAKPYGSLFSAFVVHGVWLKDPLLGGIGYDVYATADEMQDAYLPSTANGEYWLVCEPPPDEGAISNAVDQMDRSTLLLGSEEPNPEFASYLQSQTGGGKGGLLMGGEGPGGVTNLMDIIPDALSGDAGFLNAYNAAPHVSYYAVNRSQPNPYYLAAGGARGPGSTLYVVKIFTNGAFQQATWVSNSLFYPFIPVEAAVWQAQQDNPGKTVIETQLLWTVQSTPSPFLPVWKIVLSGSGQTLTNNIFQNDARLLQDSDGDGMNNARECYAGTDPTNLLNSFDIDGSRAGLGASARLVVSWPSQGGRTYSLYRGTNLNQRLPLVTSGVAATPPMNSYTDQVSLVSAFYYRVEVE